MSVYEIFARFILFPAVSYLLPSESCFFLCCIIFDYVVRIINFVWRKFSEVWVESGVFVTALCSGPLTGQKPLRTNSQYEGFKSPK